MVFHDCFKVSLMWPLATFFEELAGEKFENSDDQAIKAEVRSVISKLKDLPRGKESSMVLRAPRHEANYPDRLVLLVCVKLEILF